MREFARKVLPATTTCRIGTIGALALSLMAAVTPAGAARDAVVSSTTAATSVVIEDLRVSDGSVSGTVVNRSSNALRDVRLLFRFAWLWANERSPGRDNPSRSDFYTVAGEIAPGGSLPFTYTPRTPLPRRNDGSFDISAQVVSFTEIGE
jgi:hypothetical protein